MNCVQLLGNLCRDPELRYTASNTAVVEFSIAINERYKKADGETQETVHFIDITAWSGLAEVIAKHFRKGGKIAVTGKLTQDRWEDRESGNQRSKLKVTATGFDFCGDKRGDTAQQRPPQQQAQGGGPPAHDEDDIPF